MRQIKFRGQDKRTNEFIEGGLIQEYEKSFILPFKLTRGIPTQLEEVKPETVGQFTGLKDKNGKDVFEGDVIESEQWIPKRCQVAFDRGAFYLAGRDLHEIADIKYVEGFQVIGDVFSNPELLK